MADEKKIKELALAIATMDLDELVEGWRRRLLIMDSQIEALRQEREALAEERRKLRAERIQLHALYQINMRVLNIVNAPGKKTGEDNETDFITRFTQ
jgi:hypothetical protein